MFQFLKRFVFLFIQVVGKFVISEPEGYKSVLWQLLFIFQIQLQIMSRKCKSEYDCIVYSV